MGVNRIPGISELVHKVKVGKSKPLKLKARLNHLLATTFARNYDKVMRGIDHATSAVLIPVYDLLPRSKSQQVDYLLCRYKFSNVSGTQESLEKITLEDTLSRFAQDPKKIRFHYWDIDQPMFAFGAAFYKKVARMNPKYLVLSSYTPGAFHQPKPWVVAKLRKRGIKTVSLWWDTCSDSFAKHIGGVIDTFDIHGIMENPTLNFGPSPEAKRLKLKAIGVFCAYDLNLTPKPRDIDVAFLGQVSAYRSERRDYLDFLMERGVRLHYSAYEKDMQCTQEKYFEILSRAKIGINFSKSVDKHQLKARVFETMHSGSLLLEERNEQTAFYFEEGKEYAAFSSADELLKKIEYYLAHEDERKAIAEAGQKKAKQLFGGNPFWTKLLTPRPL